MDIKQYRAPSHVVKSGLPPSGNGFSPDAKSGLPPSTDGSNIQRRCDIEFSTSLLHRATSNFKTYQKFGIILIFILLIMNNFASAQKTFANTDTIRRYENIESYTEQNNFTKFMFRIFFKPVAPPLLKKKLNKRLIQKPYSSFEGKIIRNINIETLDPFGNSIGDTISASLNYFTKRGNQLHLKTRESTIRNLLLFKQDEPFDSLLAKESERLVRSMGYVTDVSFFLKASSEKSDSVDLFIRELDNWSIIPGGSMSASGWSVRLKDGNFMGLGHNFHNTLAMNYATGEYAYLTSYYIPNISNTYINSTIQFGTDQLGNSIKSIAFERRFFSPFTKWAAGVNVSQHLRNDSIWTNSKMQYKFNVQDLWAGKAFQIYKGNTAYSRSTQFITAIRANRIRYLEKPNTAMDTLHYYSDENFYLTSLGFSSRQYVQDKYIFKFGLTEDVPIGRVLGLTGGYQVKNKTGRLYFGTLFSSGYYHPWGYLSSNIEAGTFLHSSKAEQIVVSAGINYFTNLFEIGKIKFRQFIKPQLTFGFNRFEFDSLTLNDGFGLDGFNSPLLSGNSRLLLTSQTQSYLPWNFIGFHFGPFLTFSLGMLGDTATGFRASKIYSQIGLGILIKNDKLVMNAFQVSIAFYPSIPGIGDHIFKLNSFKTADFGFRDFEIDKPATVLFR